MNHKYDIDWLAGWMICQRLGIMQVRGEKRSDDESRPISVQGSKIVGKQSLKLVPVVGWCWIFTESIFLRRVWESDRETLVQPLRKVLADYPKNYFFNVKSSDLLLSSILSFSFYSFAKAHASQRKNVSSA